MNAALTLLVTWLLSQDAGSTISTAEPVVGLAHRNQRCQTFVYLPSAADAGTVTLLWEPSIAENRPRAPITCELTEPTPAGWSRVASCRRCSAGSWALAVRTGTQVDPGQAQLDLGFQRIHFLSPQPNTSGEDEVGIPYLADYVFHQRWIFASHRTVELVEYHQNVGPILKRTLSAGRSRWGFRKVGSPAAVFAGEGDGLWVIAVPWEPNAPRLVRVEGQAPPAVVLSSPRMPKSAW